MAIVNFTNAAEGDFNAKLGVPVVTETAIVAGDPRWTLTQEQAPFDIVINAADITEGDITAAITAATTGKLAKNITINLAAETAYKVTAPIAAAGGVIINGAAGATIDASALTGAMITMSATEAPADWTTVDNVTIKDVKITGLAKALYASTVKNFDIKNFTLDNSVVEVAADVTTFDFTKGSTVENFTINKSTIYAPTATTKSLYSSQSGQKVTEAGDDLKQTIKITNSTLYNLAPTKNFFSHRQANQAFFVYDIENNIFVDCGKSGQVIKGLNGGQGGANPTWTIKGNIFNFGGADTSAAEDTGDTTEGETVQNSIAGVVAFTNAAEGDFGGTFATTSDIESVTAGDPRWTITVEKLDVTALDATIATAEGLLEGKDATVADSPEKALSDAIVAAKAAKATATTQAEIDAANTALQNAIDAYNLATGISTVNVDAAADDNAPIYNLAGQRVDKNYKGIVIKNGKKYFNK